MARIPDESKHTAMTKFEGGVPMNPITFEDYQRRARLTSVSEAAKKPGDMISLLGLAGEVGELLTEHKKRLRDGEAYRVYNEKLSEELGDILWYVAETASNSGLNLEDVARRNLTKIENRWGDSSAHLHFDENFPEKERLPDRLEVCFEERLVGGTIEARITVDGEQFGDPLTDNSHSDDGYRFHDVLHFAYCAVLGWSPLVRHLLRRKRKSDPETDKVEDGARARVIEEGLTAIIFSFAHDHSFFENVDQVDTRLLEIIARATTGLEVSRCSKFDWEQAILAGFDAWRKISSERKGKLLVDRRNRSLEVVTI